MGPRWLPWLFPTGLRPWNLQVYGDRSRAQQHMLRCLRTRTFCAAQKTWRTMNEAGGGKGWSEVE